MADSDLEKKIEDHLEKQLEMNLTEEQIRLLESKVTTIRKLSGKS